MKIEYLADHLRLLSEIAAPTFSEWEDLCNLIGIDLAQIKDILVERVVKDSIQWLLLGSKITNLSRPEVLNYLILTQKSASIWLNMIYIKTADMAVELGDSYLNTWGKRLWYWEPGHYIFHA